MNELEIRVRDEIDDGRHFAVLDLLADGHVLQGPPDSVVSIDATEWSLRRDGEMFIFNCSCRNPGCARIERGVLVEVSRQVARRTFRGSRIRVRCQRLPLRGRASARGCQRHQGDATGASDTLIR